MPIGVGRHHQTNQSQTKDLTERIAEALVSAPAFLEKQKENASSIGTALYFVLVGPTKENAASIGTASYYALVGPTSAVCSQRYFDCSSVVTIQVMVICKTTI